MQRVCRGLQILQLMCVNSVNTMCRSRTEMTQVAPSGHREDCRCPACRGPSDILHTRIDPEVLAWMRAQPETFRALVERWARAEMERQAD